MEAKEYSFVFTDVTYRRFLRGRKNVLDDAVAAMINYSDWRKENDVDGLTEADCPNQIRKQVTFIHGRDKMNRPVINTLAGRHDKDNRDPAELKRFIIYMIEETVRQSNPEEETLTIVFDLTSFGFQCMDYEAVKLLITILQTNYPEVLGQALIINSPFIFWACWAIIKGWLDPVTAAKVHFIGLEDVPNYIDDPHPDIGQPTSPLPL